MPGTTPPTSQLDWLSSTTAMIVLFWSRATRDLLRSFGSGIAALHRENAATKLPCLAARPIASIGPAWVSDGPEIPSRPSAAQTPLADEADRPLGRLWSSTQRWREPESNSRFPAKGRH